MAKTKLPQKHRDMPATVGLVYEVRDELKADIRALDAKMESRFAQVDSRFAQIDSRFDQIDSRFSKQDARMSSMDEKIEKILASVHRTQAIVEEQRSENKVMLEALHGFVQRMDRMEKRQDEVDLTLRALAKPIR